MAEVPSLLLITWNRAEYVRKTVAQLLSCSSAFRLYCWDNHSEPETADFIRDLKDDRIVARHFHHENANQEPPVRWFLDQVPEGLVGKIDDDVLLPHGWLERISDAVSASDRMGMLGCWIYNPEDYLPDIAAVNVVEVNAVPVLRTALIAGHSFLARRAVCRAYLCSVTKGRWGIPINRSKMALDGLILGYPLPLVYAHNMDDPRSDHCLMRKTGISAEQAALTARKLGFKTLDEYTRWIRADAIRRQVIPFDEQIAAIRQGLFRHTFVGRVLHRLERLCK